MEIARDQLSLINARQLAACGIGKQVRHRRVKAGRLIPILPRVYRAAGTQPHPLERTMAAVLWAGKGAVASHSSAATARGLDRFREAPIHITVAREVKAAHGINVHRVDTLADADVSTVGCIPVTSAPRMMQELAAIRHPSTERALDQILREGRVSLEELWTWIECPDRWGRRGTRRLRDLLETRTTDRAPTHSEMEDLLKRIVRRHRLPTPRQQWPIALAARTIHADFAYPDGHIAIECDSYAWHMNRKAFEIDRLRDIELQSLGWIVLRFTWAMLKWRQEYVAGQIRHHLAMRTQLPV
jgi:very-short-patch-repair endonuclease